MSNEILDIFITNNIMLKKYESEESELNEEQQKIKKRFEEALNTILAEEAILVSLNNSFNDDEYNVKKLIKQHLLKMFDVTEDEVDDKIVNDLFTYMNNKLEANVIETDYNTGNNTANNIIYNNEYETDYERKLDVNNDVQKTDNGNLFSSELSDWYYGKIRDYNFLDSSLNNYYDEDQEENVAENKEEDKENRMLEVKKKLDEYGDKTKRLTDKLIDTQRSLGKRNNSQYGKRCYESISKNQKNNCNQLEELLEDLKRFEEDIIKKPTNNTGKIENIYNYTPFTNDISLSLKSRIEQAEEAKRNTNNFLYKLGTPPPNEVPSN